MQATQLIDINIADTPLPPSTAVASPIIPNLTILIGLILLILTIITITAFIIKKKRHGKPMLAKTSLFVMILLAIAAIAINPTAVSADTYIAALSSITVNIVKPTGNTNPITKTAQYETTVTTGNETGYTLSAKLDTSSEDTTDSIGAGIRIRINNENITTAPTDVFTDDTGTSPSIFTHELSITVPAGIKVGSYKVSVVYKVRENEPYLADIVEKNNIVTMQELTSALCASAGYDFTNNGVNSNNTITLTDTRNNQDYNVRKLADGNCWMINNLKLGSLAESIELTPQDTNITQNWTLPQIDNTSSFDYEIPHVYSYWDDVDGGNDLTMGNNISTDDFYGYYYNWCAATAGDTAPGGSNTCTGYDTMPDDATGDICPANWRLPTGGPSGEFYNLYNAFGSEYLSQFQFSGAFRGVFSGARDGSNWLAPSYSGGLWSSSLASDDHSSIAYTLTLWSPVIDIELLPPGLSYVNPVTVTSRPYGLPIRCLLK